jgi:hypothetical protein
VQGKLGGYELVEDSAELLNDFDIFEYLSNVEGLTATQERVSSNENPTAQRKLQSRLNAPTAVSVAEVPGQFIRVMFDGSRTSGVEGITYRVELFKDDRQIFTKSCDSVTCDINYSELRSVG